MMLHSSLYLLLIVSVTHFQRVVATPSTPSSTTTKIAFGSCSKVDEPQPMWKIIDSRNPKMFIWGGDNIYSDVRKYDIPFWIKKRLPSWLGGSTNGDKLIMPLPGNRTNFRPRSLKDHAEMYKKQKKIKDYETLKKTTRIVGTWDDHDCGINDADKHFYDKKRRQQLHLDFLDVPRDDLERRKNREGIYSSHVVDNIKVILLDVRYHRDAWPWHLGAKNNSWEEGDILGEEQWKWLERELLVKDDQVDLTLIVSGIQILPIVMMAETKHETWYHFHNCRQKLFNTIHTLSTKPILLLSGDVHYAELSEETCIEVHDDGGTDSDGVNTFRLIEFTSSGLTHAWAGSPLNWPKPYPFAPLLFRYLWWWWNIAGVHPWRSMAYAGMNFGEIELNVTDNYRKEVHLKAIDIHNEIQFQTTIPLHELISGGGSNGSSISSNKKKKGKVICSPLHGQPSKNTIQLAKLLFLGLPFITALIIFNCFRKTGYIGCCYCCCCCFTWFKRCCGTKNDQRKNKEKKN